MSQRVPRNAPALFNLGARQFRALFHDGRVAIDPATASGFATPAGADLPTGLDTVLAAQALFPVTSAIEMTRLISRWRMRPMQVPTRVPSGLSTR